MLIGGRLSRDSDGWGVNACQRVRPPLAMVGSEIFLRARGGARGGVGFFLDFARQWVAGEAMEDAIRVAKEANERGIEAVGNHLGEHYREKAPVEATTREYLQLLATMRTEGIRGEVSIKPTQFGVFIDKEYALAQ